MLILTRYSGEALLIGEARVTILGVAGAKQGHVRVTLGIEAPPDIRILRAELPQLEQAEKNGAPTAGKERYP